MDLWYVGCGNSSGELFLIETFLKIVPFMGTIMKSKEEDILNLFFEFPTKHWHFEDVVKSIKISRSKINNWLKKFIKEDLIKRIKKRGKMPYYIANYDSPNYQNRKKLFAQTQLYNSGFLNHLLSLKKVNTIILFGSFVRWDWHKYSDVDLFVFGDLDGLNLGKYELKLNRDIQLFACKNKKDLKKFGVGFVKNILKGDLIKGDLSFLKVSLNA